MTEKHITLPGKDKMCHYPINHCQKVRKDVHGIEDYEAIPCPKNLNNLLFSILIPVSIIHNPAR